MQFQSQSSSASPRAQRSPAEWPAPLVQALTDVAARHGFELEVAQVLWEAVTLGQGGMAQFSHPTLGGSGQWMRGGMLMIGDMFDQGLKARVNALCEELAELYAAHPPWRRPPTAATPEAGVEWWPKELHAPSSSGAQNGIRYAYFPAQHRLAIERAGAVELYDTGDHLIGGVSQQQGGRESLTFASQHGPVALSSLKRVNEADASVAPTPATSSATSTSLASSAPSTPSAAPRGDTVPPTGPPSPGAPAHAQADRAAAHTLDTIERLAGLRDRGVLTEADFIAKKTELLGRL
ncbi:SHOCT domain-containing protein [Variovorax sp. J22R24]|uniref:SHOCT domain-containing protein n=1 Tax=Variovorax gracilis TaxID=3053502 RepID=UPI0025759EE7|nr:SHOCT domain-containing protein [Variovorax sp. J22R24]MDM0108850.1 SHOCT domain-containing protein [Variovorax sp. J22R24]